MGVGDDVMWQMMWDSEDVMLWVMWHVQEMVCVSTHELQHAVSGVGGCMLQCLGSVDSEDRELVSRNWTEFVLQKIEAISAA